MDESELLAQHVIHAITLTFGGPVSFIALIAFDLLAITLYLPALDVDVRRDLAFVHGFLSRLEDLVEVFWCSILFTPFKSDGEDLIVFDCKL